MLNIVMDVDDSVIRLLTQNLQTLRMEGVPGYNMGTMVNHLEGYFPLLETLGTYQRMQLLNNIIFSTACDDFCGFMKKK